MAKMHRFGEGFELGKKTKFALKIVQKALKWPLQYQVFEGAYPQTPLETLLFFNLLQIKLAKKRNYT